MGRGPLTSGGRMPGSAAMTLRAVALTHGHRDDGTRGFRPIWRKIAEIRDIGDPGPAGSRAADECCPTYPNRIFFFLIRAGGSRAADQRCPALP
ncbi:hypothetical protein CRG98_048035, partial [Punica granatum]